MSTGSTFSEVKEFLKNRYFLGSLWALVFLAITALPPVVIENATRSSRVTWFAFLAGITCIGAISAVAASFSDNEIEKPKENYPLLPYFLMLLLYVAAVVFSVLIANVTDGAGEIASVARTMTSLIEPIFPWIGNFRVARVGWGMSGLQILKTESITTLWFLFGILLVLLLVWQRALLTPAQRVYERKYSDWVARNRGTYKSGVSIFFVLAFGLWLAISQFFGWSGLSPASTYSAKRLCLVTVQCYYVNDLAILAAAGTKCIAIFGFSAGSILMVRDFFAQPL